MGYCDGWVNISYDLDMGRVTCGGAATCRPLDPGLCFGPFQRKSDTGGGDEAP
jgi:hypothetical protein